MSYVSHSSTRELKKLMLEKLSRFCERNLQATILLLVMPESFSDPWNHESRHKDASYNAIQNITEVRPSRGGFGARRTSATRGRARGSRVLHETRRALHPGGRLQGGSCAPPAGTRLYQAVQPRRANHRVSHVSSCWVILLSLSDGDWGVTNLSTWAQAEIMTFMLSNDQFTLLKIKVPH